MRDVTIRSRADGITELAPKLAPLRSGDRFIVIFTVLLTTGALFVSGLVPARVAALVLAFAVAGDVLLGLKAAALAVFRPRAPVHELPSVGQRRGRTTRLE